MALHRLGCSVAIGLTSFMLGACGNQVREGNRTATPVVEVVPETQAMADVDRRATLALKQNLLTRFPENSASAQVEAGLTKDGYACGPNPTAPSERACLKVVREGVCEVNMIIRSAPYAPEKAQTIRICATAPASPQGSKSD